MLPASEEVGAPRAARARANSPHVVWHPCPSCAFPCLLRSTRTVRLQYAGALVTVYGLEGCRCHRCGHRTVLPAQDERNRTRLNDAHLGALAGKWAVTRPVAEDPPGDG